MQTVIRSAWTPVVWAALVCGTTALAGAQATGGATGSPVKIAFIRSQDIFAQAPGRSDAEAQFNKEVEGVRAQEKAMGDSINAMFADYAKSESTLTADTKQARQQAIRDKQAAYQQKQQQLEQQMQQRQGELVQPILERINRIINDLRTENNYAMVFDAQANGGGVVAADKNLDITDQVIKRLRESSPVATTPPSTTPSKSATTKPTSGPTAGPSGVTRPKSPSQ
jgi:outer membrane protein